MGWSGSEGGGGVRWLDIDMYIIWLMYKLSTEEAIPFSATLPVCVWKQCSLNDSASRTSMPEDLCSGDNLAEMAKSLGNRTNQLTIYG